MKNSKSLAFLLICCGSLSSCLSRDIYDYKYIEIARSNSSIERYLVEADSSDSQKVSISDIDEEKARHVLFAFSKHIRKESLKLDGVELKNIVVNRVFVLPLGETIIGFTSNCVNYSAQFDWRASHISNLSLNAVD